MSILFINNVSIKVELNLIYIKTAQIINASKILQCALYITKK